MTRRPLVVVMLAGALTAALLAGCGSSSPSISQDASTQLDLQAQAVRNAAAALDRDGAETALADLRRSVEELRARNKISADRKSKVLGAAAAVEAQLQSIPTTTTTTTPPTTRVPPSTRNDNNGRKDKGKNGGGGD
jgi:predicted component of type VI protein secretion system